YCSSVSSSRTVRFWNFTCVTLQKPVATSTNSLAISRSPLWLQPISAMSVQGGIRLLDGGPAAVDDEHRAGHVARRVRAKEDECALVFVTARHASHDRARGVRAHERRVMVVLDAAGHERVDA